MAIQNMEWEDFPSYVDLAKDILAYVEKAYTETFIENKEPHSIESTGKYYNITSSDILLLIFFSFIWTILRYLTTETIFKPLAKYYGLTPTNQIKMPESAWKFLYFFCAWNFTFYVVVWSGKYTFFQKPSTIWNDWDLQKRPALDIYIIYMGQCSFYLHAMYATVFMDTWRKDYLVMMVHHVLTLVLISISYSLGYHNIGTIVLLTHDICDIFMEFTKLNVYFKIQNNRKVRRHEILANISFFLFTIVWHVSRLYVYPLRVLYAATSILQRLQLILPYNFFMNSLLWMLQIMDIYWSVLILELLYRVATGQIKEVDDTREYDVEEKFRQLTQKNSISDSAQPNDDIKDIDDGNLKNGDANDALRNTCKK